MSALDQHILRVNLSEKDLPTYLRKYLHTYLPTSYRACSTGLPFFLYTSLGEFPSKISWFFTWIVLSLGREAARRGEGRWQPWWASSWWAPPCWWWGPCWWGPWCPWYDALGLYGALLWCRGGDVARLWGLFHRLNERKWGLFHRCKTWMRDNALKSRKNACRYGGGTAL